jgi:hypothetical protein
MAHSLPDVNAAITLNATLRTVMTQLIPALQTVPLIIN